MTYTITHKETGFRRHGLAVAEELVGAQYWHAIIRKATNRLVRANWPGTAPSTHYRRLAAFAFDAYERPHRPLGVRHWKLSLKDWGCSLPNRVVSEAPPICSY
jgi:hypothetical protein